MEHIALGCKHGKSTVVVVTFWLPLSVCWLLHLHWCTKIGALPVCLTWLVMFSLLPIYFSIRYRQATAWFYVKHSLLMPWKQWLPHEPIASVCFTPLCFLLKAQGHSEHLFSSHVHCQTSLRQQLGICQKMMRHPLSWLSMCLSCACACVHSDEWCHVLPPLSCPDWIPSRARPPWRRSAASRLLDPAAGDWDARVVGSFILDPNRIAAALLCDLYLLS